MNRLYKHKWTLCDGEPARINNIIYAGRFAIAKRPLMFVEAIHLLLKQNVDLNGWNFFMYGRGHQEEEVKQKIKEYGLEKIINLSHDPDLTKVFEQSKCFVSTQDHENFPSLAMNEAM